MLAVEAATINPTDKTVYVDLGAGSDPGETNATSILQHSRLSQKRRRDDNEQTAFSGDDTSHVADTLQGGTPFLTSNRQLPETHATSTVLHWYESSSSILTSDASDFDELQDNTKQPIVLSSNDA